MATLVVRPGGLSADRYLRAGLEAVVLALVVATPWALGAVEPLFFRFVLAGVAVLLLLWSARLVVTGELRWRSCPGTLGLTGLFVLTLIQLIPLPSSVLSVAAPETRSLLHDLLPTVPETLPGDVPSAAAADRPLSLYSGATRDFLIQILAVFLIYVVVRQQLASAATLRRLAWACLLNGVALALFALCQAFSSPPNVVYGAFRVDGAVFGPFICRNHFPFYMHLCIGLGVGLLRPESPPDKRRARPRGSFEPGEVLAALQSPRALGVLLALGLMLAASAYSLSRGGVLAQFAALVISAGVWWRSKVQPRGWLGAAAAAVLLAMLLGAWFGLTPLEDRLATLADSDQLNNSRGQLWRNVLPLARRFPLVGTGNGTFAFVEPMTRDQPRTGVMFVHEFAHNEYLEALIEGGVIRLGLTLLLVGGVLVRLGRFVGRHPGDGFALGGFWALTAVAVHSIFDFGIHLPAIAILTAVAAAQMMNRADARPSETSPSPSNRLAAWLSAAVLAPLAFLLLFEGWCLDRAERWRQAAGLASLENRFDYLEAAVRLRPDDATLHQALGQAYLNAWREGSTGHLRPALVHLVAARDLCPVLSHPHARLAELRGELAIGDPAIAYLERARRLQPWEPELWYACGLQHLNDGRPDQAWPLWRRYLKMADARLDDVLSRAASRLGPDGVREQVLPDRPQLFVTAAERLFPRPQDEDKRKPFLENALTLWDRAGAAGGAALRQKARVQLALRRPGEALASYAAALKAEPQQAGWRLEYARLLRDTGNLTAARAELTLLNRGNTKPGEARDLLDVVEREISLREQLERP